MILIALRILFGAALGYGLSKVWQNAQTAPATGDLANAFYLAVCVILAVANAVVWAPFFGDVVSGPLTGVITRSTYVGRKNLLLRFIHWLENRGFRRLALCFCFLEGVHHPHRPAAFVIGLTNARPGSWLEKVYAWEVFKFDNARHCMEAYEALRWHGIDPRPHRNPEVNMVLISLEREVRPPAETIIVPPAPPPPPLKRDRRISLFEVDEPRAADAQAQPKAADEEKATGSAGSLEPATADTGGACLSSENERILDDGKSGWRLLTRIRAFFRRS
jgi:hypothetical protein